MDAKIIGVYCSSLHQQTSNDDWSYSKDGDEIDSVIAVIEDDGTPAIEAIKKATLCVKNSNSSTRIQNFEMVAKV